MKGTKDLQLPFALSTQHEMECPVQASLGRDSTIPDVASVTASSNHSRPQRKISAMTPNQKRMTANLKLLSLALLLSLRPQPLCAAPQAPDLGPNVFVFSPSMPAAAIQNQIDKVYAIQQHSEFGPARNAFLFLPGSYNVDVPIGFYTQVLGLGVDARCSPHHRQCACRRQSAAQQRHLHLLARR